MDMLKVTSWNLQGLGNNETELNNIFKEYEINMAAIKEMKKKITGLKELHDMLYSGVDQKKKACYCLTLLVNSKRQDQIRQYNVANERKVMIRLTFDRFYIT